MTNVHKLRLAAIVAAVLTVLAACLGGPPRRARVVARPRKDADVVPGTSARSGEFRRRNPFRLERQRIPPPPPPDPSPAPRRPPPPTRGPAPKLPLKLVGTIDAGRYAMAFFTGAGPGQVALEAATDLGEILGEPFRGLVLAEIHRRKAIFRGQGREIVLEVDGNGPGGPAGRAAPSAAPPPPSPPVPPDAAATSATVVELARPDVQRHLSNLAYLVTQASAQPYFEDGAPAGIRVSRIQPGSVPALLGLRNGDVLRGVNGTPLRVLPDAVRLLRAFQAGKGLRLKVLRGGQLQAIDYRIE